MRIGQDEIVYADVKVGKALEYGSLDVRETDIAFDILSGEAVRDPGKDFGIKGHLQRNHNKEPEAEDGPKGYLESTSLPGFLTFASFLSSHYNRNEKLLKQI